MNLKQKKIIKFSTGLIIAGILVLFLTARFERPQIASGGSGVYETIRGWAWSENVGWLNFNCYNDYNHDGQWENCCPGGGNCPHSVAGGNYGVQYNDNKLTNYAWAGENSGEGLGWICFGETCCSGSCNGELADKAPDGNDAWACVGRRQTDGSCAADCGQYFNTADGSGCTGSGSTCSADSDSSFKAHWRLNSLSGAGGDEVEDCQGGDTNKGVLKPTLATGPVLATGKWNNALKFDGTDDYIEVVGGSSLNIANAITVESWVYPKARQATSDRDMILRRHYYLTITPAGKMSVYFYGLASAGYHDSNGTVPLNKWSHLAVTYDSSTGNIKMYINGELDRTINTSGTITTGSVNLLMGGEITTRFFNGLIDNVAIYSRAKTAEQIWDDAHIEVSGWAKVVNMGDKGWLKLKGQDTSGAWFGAYLNNYSQGGGFYSVGGFGWQTEGNEEMDFNGLLGHWKMNGDWTDSSGKGNNGTAGGDAAWVANGKFEKAGTFDGAGDYVSIPLISTATNNVTLEAWVKWSGTTTNHQVIFYNGNSETSGYGFYLNYTNGNKLRGLNGGVGWVDPSPDYYLTVGQWYHIAMVRDAGIWKMYVNGSQLTVVGNPTPNTPTNGTFIASEHLGTSNFNGLIDNTAIYNRAKTATEISDDFQKQYGYLAGALSDKVIPFGWFKGSPSIATVTPTAFDTFRVTNYGCTGTTTMTPNLYLQWSPALWAESYNYYRVQNAGPVSNCGTCPPAAGYTEYPVLSDACGASSCSFRDSNGSILENNGYCYCLKAVNESGSTWATSNPPTYPHPYWKLVPLCAPTGVGVDGTKCGYNKVAWQPNATMATNADGYNIYRSLTYAGCDATKSWATLSDMYAAVVGGTCEIVAHAGEALTTFNPASGNNGLVGWWKMNENFWNGTANEVWDSSGNENHGTAAGGVSTDTGKFNKAGNFIAASSHYLDFGESSKTNLDFSTEDFSIELWVKFNSVGVAEYLIDKGTGSYIDGYGIAINDGTTDNKINFITDGDGGSGAKYYLKSDSAITTGQWYHIAAVRDDGTKYLYINGVKQTTTQSDSRELSDTSRSLYIGKPDVDSGGYFNGLIDNTAIYNYAKSAGEILKDAEAFPLETTPSGNNNSCALGDNAYIPIYCPNQKNPQNCGSDPTDGCTGTNNFCLTCTNSQKCCRYFDKRVQPNLPYFYRTSAFTGQGGESPGSPIRTDHSDGCVDSSGNGNPDYADSYRRACDRSVCRTPIKFEEK